ncbi:glucose/arabinose dehydrogenase [Nocardioides daedukensis]|uniref:Glucose/arabinose dehydrogenase n=1 Tax=Nocardioides daedukensis TaxID=634462 RepID=A0A7Y9S156_9ACTN|nr:PQQ-dependent sugar dehydrogenase [Nocardioides daedukensis]NYG58253.1 glucose/arabinose dehydrogenase [Nocardioides daedukensis]
MRSVATALVLSLAVLAACSSEGDDSPTDGRSGSSPTGQSSNQSPSQSPSDVLTATPAPSDPKSATVTRTVVSGLEAPWGLDFLPDGTAVVTERDSRRVLVIEDGKAREIGTVTQAAPGEEAGLLGVAVSPDFEQDKTLFLYLTTQEDNRIVRTTYDGKRLGELDPIVTGIPRGMIHDGGRLAFGPDGLLIASTGDSGDQGTAQDEDSLGGKILRMTPEGKPAPGNPNDDLVLSLGHRNVQGLAFDSTGQLWASEFGSQEFDELNRIEAGRNYGWPQFEGEGGTDQMTDPQVVWSTDEASPSGLAFAEGHLWMASLRGERLWRVDVAGGKASAPKDFFVGDYGRLRTVALAPNGKLWLTTSNRDGRGDPAKGDDRILEVTLK